MWPADDADLKFAQYTSISGQIAQQRKKRGGRRALNEITGSKLRRLLARNKSFGCPDISAEDSVLAYTLAGRKRAPRWRGPAVVLDIDVIGAAVEIQGQTFRAARYCAR